MVVIGGDHAALAGGQMLTGLEGEAGHMADGTGGQHRSVYSAQHMAEHLNKKFGVKVELIHREQNIEQTFEAKN